MLTYKINILSLNKMLFILMEIILNTIEFNKQRKRFNRHQVQNYTYYHDQLFGNLFCYR